MSTTRPTRIRFAILAAAAAAFAAVLLAAPGGPTPALAAANALTAPPVGGLTQGVAGTTDPAALAAAQAFPVEAISMLDVATQQWLIYVPGAPSQVDTLGSSALTVNSVVTIRRTGAPPAPGTPAAAPSGVAPSGAGNALSAPAPGGLTVGVAGTNDPATLAAAQSFPVETVTLLDIPSQAWLVYVPGAPAFASSLRTGMLQAGSVVTLRRAGGAGATPTSTPTATTPSGIDAAAETALVTDVNQARAAAGLPALVVDATIRSVARSHSLDMVQNDYFAHDSLDGTDPFQRMRNAGVTFTYADENIAAGNTADEVHSELMNSAPHRANILDPRMRRIGIGVATGGTYGLTVTEDFAD